MATSDDDEADEGEEGEAGDEEEGDRDTPADQSTSPKRPQSLEPLLPEPVTGPVTEDAPSTIKPGTVVTDFIRIDQPASETMDEKASENASENAALSTSNPLPLGKSPELIPVPDKAVELTEVPAVNEAIQQAVLETVPTVLPSPPPGSKDTETKVIREVQQEEEGEEEEMLLDIVENAENVNIGGDSTPSLPAVEGPVAEALEPELPQ